MYPHFIEVTSYCKMMINIDSIMSIIPCVEGTKIYTIDGTDGSYLVSEKYAELKDLIRNAGCAIQKADPRLDGTIPLTMDDLCKLEMVGEPVWNSNTRHWMLIVDSANDNRSWVDLVDNCGKIIRFDPHDVSKFPLYRLRKEMR